MAIDWGMLQQQINGSNSQNNGQQPGGQSTGQPDGQPDNSQGSPQTGVNWGALQNPQHQARIIQTAPSQGNSGGGIGDILSGIAGLVGGVTGMAGKAANTAGGQTGTVLGAGQQAGFRGQGQGNVFQGGNSAQSIGTSQPNVFQAGNMSQGQGSSIGDQLYNSASSLLGKHEGDPVLSSYLQKTNPNLDPTQTPWCAGYVGSVLGANGIKGTGSLAAKSYLKFGTPTTSPSRGDIAVFNDMTGNNDPAHGHVGFVNSIDTKRGVVSVLGGNQGNSVSVKEYPLNMVAGFRVPPSGQQVQQFAQQQGMTHPSQVAGMPNQINQQANLAGQQVTASPQRPINAFNQQYLPQNAHPELANTMAGIAHVESPGETNPYQLTGPRTRRGDYAVGKYQIMSSNIPAWSREALGYPVTSEQFKNSPELQERVAAYQINKNLKQYGNANDAYSVWFSGRPANKAGNARDSFGTTVPAYIKKANQGALMYREQQRQTPRPSMSTNNKGSLQQLAINSDPRIGQGSGVTYPNQPWVNANDPSIYSIQGHPHQTPDNLPNVSEYEEDRLPYNPNA